MLDWIAWVAVAVTTLWNAGGVVAVARATRRRSMAAGATRAVSVLKPLCGGDAELEANLESFFAQDHEDFELLFGVVDEDDPALPIVRRVARRHPSVRCQIVVHGGSGALNPKIDNLSGLLPRATHDLVLISDSNVRAPRDYLREIVSAFERHGAGLVTNLFVGGTTHSFGEALESVELAGFCAAGVALPTLLGDPLLVGKSALFLRSELERLGGLERLSDVLAEDFVLGKTFAHAGRRVVLARTVLTNAMCGVTVRSALRRHLRWSMLRFRLRPLAAVLEPLTSPLALLPLAWVALGPWAIVWSAAVIAIRDVGGWLVLKGREQWWVPLLLGPLRDVLALAIWAIAPLKQHVSWRGKRYRLGAGTLLYPARKV